MIISEKLILLNLLNFKILIFSNIFYNINIYINIYIKMNINMNFLIMILRIYNFLEREILIIDINITFNQCGKKSEKYKKFNKMKIIFLSKIYLI